MDQINREQLEQISKDKLIEIILGQQEIIEQQQARLEELKVQIERLSNAWPKPEII